MKSILITGARAPVALHFARLLSTDGNKIFLGDSFNYPISRSSTLSHEYIRLPEPRFDYENYAKVLRRTISKQKIDLVIPTCEEVFYLSHLWEEHQLEAELFAPDFDTLKTLHNKYEFIKTTQSLGLATPETHFLNSEKEIDSFRESCTEFVFKPVWSRFASEVLVCPNQLEDHQFEISDRKPWVAQRHVQGLEICTYAFVYDGEVRACASYHPKYRAGKGAGIFFQPVDNQHISEFVRRIASETKYSGNLSFDFIQTADGEILPIECNPRATSGLHFFTEPAAFSALFDVKAKIVQPDISNPLASHIAMLVFGAPKLFSYLNCREYLSDLRASSDILDWPGDHLSKFAQLRTFVEILTKALGNKITPQQAATRDIEWNGEHI